MNRRRSASAAERTKVRTHALDAGSSWRTALLHAPPANADLRRVLGTRTGSRGLPLQAPERGRLHGRAQTRTENTPRTSASGSALPPPSAPPPALPSKEITPK
uniref:Uncharacterized protein n=1 Tax=Knipowitschia caucasica TaxID=637954 RepID=A0AAV2MF96_KNICA